MMHESDFMQKIIANVKKQKRKKNEIKLKLKKQNLKNLFDRSQ